MKKILLLVLLGLLSLPVHAQKNALFIYGNTPMNASDVLISNQLATLGFTVEAIRDNVTYTAQALGKDIIVISRTIGSGNVLFNGVHKWLDVAIPIINLESDNYDELLMTATSAGYGTQGSRTTLNIVRSDHPLAAGLDAGIVTVRDSNGTIVWGVPNSEAVVIAEQNDNSARKTIFAYDTGDLLFDNYGFVGPTAAGRRIGLFLENNFPAAMNANGWALFDAAVNQGVDTASRMLQAAIGVKVDGIVGPKTLAAAWRKNGTNVVLEIAAQRGYRYGCTGHFTRFGLGWMRRLMDSTSVSLEELQQ